MPSTLLGSEQFRKQLIFSVSRPEPQGGDVVSFLLSFPVLTHTLQQSTTFRVHSSPHVRLSTVCTVFIPSPFGVCFCFIVFPLRRRQVWLSLRTRVTNPYYCLLCARWRRLCALSRHWFGSDQVLVCFLLTRFYRRRITTQKKILRRKTRRKSSNCRDCYRLLL